MQYCAKCRRVFEDGSGKCPNCKSRQLRPAGEGDMVLLMTADMYCAGRINEALMGAGIEVRLESSGSAYFSFDTSPTDQNIFVPYESLQRAGEIAAGVGREVEEERRCEEDGTPRMKRIAGEVLSVLAFLVLIMLAVYGADGLAEWIRGLMGA